jgi:preprotein translocase subunit YajC
VTDEFIVLEVGDGQELKFQKGSVVAALPKGTLKAI